MNPIQTAQTHEAKLDVAAQLEDSATLRLVYMFENRSSRSIYVFNRLYHRINKQLVFETDRNLVNVEVDGPRVIVSKKVLPVPTHIDVEKPYVPCATLVRPGERFEERLALALPLRAWTPYTGDGDAEDTVVTREAWFEIGVFTAPPESDALAATVRTLDGPAKYFDGFPATGQQTLRVGPLPFVVAVRVSDHSAGRGRHEPPKGS